MDPFGFTITAEILAAAAEDYYAVNEISIGPDVQRLKDLELDLQTSAQLWSGAEAAEDRADIIALALLAAERLAVVGHPAGRMTASLARMV
jgi:hypothetical protein